MVVVFVQAPNGKQFLGTPHLTFDQAVFRTDAGFQGQSAIGPQLSLAAETMRSLDQGHRQRRANRPQIRNLSQLRGDGMLSTFGQQFPPRLLTQVLQHVQLLIESLRSSPYAGFPNLGQPLSSMPTIVDIS